MSYKPGMRPFDEIDRTYPSEIAAKRPLGATRIHCAQDYHERDPDHTLRGMRPDPPSEPLLTEHEERETVCERFNRELREGLGTARPENIDE